ncbi:uncharacterized protein [Hyperolius riggenbachi]|uniref:uncharacterized protein n=1 Tax=Hyperolius riggenbachi TaxID=752182 RepID=UPI0035A2C43D
MATQTYVQQETGPVVGNCPLIKIKLEGKEVNGLLDTGSQVTTISEAYFARNFPGKIQDLEMSWIELAAANNLPIPVKGIIWMDVEIGEEQLGKRGIMVVKGQPSSETPIIVGMNILQDLDGRLFSQYGHRYWQKVSRQQEERRVFQNLIKTCSAIRNAKRCKGRIGVIRAPCEKGLSVPPRSEVVMQVAVGSNCQIAGLTVMVEPVNPRLDITVAKTVATVKNGQVPIRMSNWGKYTVHIPSGAWLADVFPVESVGGKEVQVEERGKNLCSCRIMSTDSDTKAQEWNGEKISQTVVLDVEQLNDNEKSALNQLFERNKEVFSIDESDLGCSDKIRHEIRTDTAGPIRERYRYIPPNLFQEVKQMLEQMLAANVIEPSSSPWAAPIVLVKKKDGSLRFCVDYRKLNSVTIKDAYPLPRIEDSLLALGKAKVFSTLDLCSGYWQILVDKKDQEKTAFTTPMGLYQFKRMPFGLTNAPATFQRLMESCLGEFNFEHVLIYLDDIIVYSTDFHQHIQHLDVVFQKLRSYGLKLKPSKCHLFKPEVNFLGHVISKEGVKPNPEKVKLIKEWPVPTTIREVRAFLGIASYYRRFIPHFAQKARPLHFILKGAQLRKKNDTVCWNTEQQKAFDELKAEIESSLILAFADFHLPFRLYTDASNQGLGAVLTQEKGGKERVIAFASRSLRETEKNPANYSSFRLELLAVVWAVTEKFSEYLNGVKFTIYTDNNPVAYLQTAKLGAMEQRWIARLAKFQFTIKYRPGRINGYADALSRFPYEPAGRERDEDLEEVEVPLFGIKEKASHMSKENEDELMVNMMEVIESSSAEWQKLQEEDHILKPLKEKVRAQVWPKRIQRVNWTVEGQKLLRQWDRLRVENNFLVRKVRLKNWQNVRSQIVLTRDVASKVITTLHEKLGHPGPEKIAWCFRKRFYCLQMEGVIKKVCRECLTCNTNQGTEPKLPLVKWRTSAPLEVVAVDFLSLDTAQDGRSSVLVMIDHFTKFAVAIPTRDQTAVTAAKHLWNDFIQTYGCPQRIHSDQGPCFKSRLMQELCQLYNIKKSHTTPYHPQGNGVCERFNRTLIQKIRSLEQEKKQRWPVYIKELVWAYNHTVHDATGYAPFHLFFGREDGGPLDVLCGRLEGDQTSRTMQEWVENHKNRVQEMYDLVRRSNEKESETFERRWNFQVGDIVLLRNKGTHEKGKLTSRWGADLWKIVNQPSTDIPVYDVQKMDGTGPIKRVNGALLKLMSEPKPFGKSKNCEMELEEMVPCWVPVELSSGLTPQAQRNRDQNLAHPVDEWQDVSGLREESSGSSVKSERGSDADQQVEGSPELEPEGSLRRSSRENIGLPPKRYLQEEFICNRLVGYILAQSAGWTLTSIDQERTWATYLPKFTGNNMPLRDWAERIQSAIKAYKVPVDMHREVAILASEGDARKTIINASRDLPVSLEDILEILEEIYGDPSDLHVVRKRFMDRTQREQESIPQFANALQELMRAIQKKEDAEDPYQNNGMSSWLKDQFVLGLRSHVVRRAVKNKLELDPAISFQSIQRLAIKYQQEEEITQLAMRQLNSDAKEKESENRHTAHTSASKKGEEAIELGHILKQMQEDIAKLRLHQETSTICSQWKQSEFKLEPPRVEGRTLGMATQTYVQQETGPVVGNCPLIKIKLEGKEVNGLLDTGSQVTTISEAYFARNFPGKIQDLEMSWIELAAANNLPIPVKGIIWMDVEIGEEQLGKRGIMVVKGQPSSETPIIVGMNILQDLDGRLFSQYGHRYWQKVSRQQEERRVFQNLIKTCSAIRNAKRCKGRIGVIRAPCEKGLSVPPRSEVVMQVAVGSNCQIAGLTVMVEPVNPRLDITVAKTVATVKNGQVPIRMSNWGKYTVHIPSGAWLADVFPVESVGGKEVQVEERGKNLCSCRIMSTDSDTKAQEWNGEKISQTVVLDVEQLNDNEKSALNQLFERNKEVFSIDESDLGCSDKIRHEIRTDTAGPIRERYRYIPPNLFQEVKQMLEQMLAANVIEPSSSPWAAPIVLVKKKDGSLRFCVDYRKLNSVTIKDAYPLPRIEDSLLALGKAKVFSTLDLCSGYWQILVDKKDQEKTAFTTPMGLYQFKRMPFGLTNAPATFQRLMESCLGEFNFEHVLIYLDDIIVYSTDFHQHIQHLDVVFQKLRSYGLKLKPSKCHLFKPEVNFLGHVISKEGVKPNPEKVKLIKEWPVPTTIREVRAFLGIASYYRRFIPHFAQKARPLHFILKGAQLRKKNDTVCWNTEQQKAFDELKAEIESSLILAFADFHLPFRLYTDASNQGLGAVLTQEKGGKERVIAFASRSLRETEKNPANYSSFRLELLAVVWAVTEKFSEYLNGVKFTIYTDNNPVAYLQTAKLGAMEQRWIARLAKFQFTIKYRPGRINGYADALSRFPYEPAGRERDEDLEEVEVPLFGIKEKASHMSKENEDELMVNMMEVIESSSAEWQKLQEEDHILKPLKEKVRAQVWPKRIQRVNWTVEGQKLLRQWDRLRVENNFLVRKVRLKNWQNVRSQIVLTRDVASKVITTLHEKLGHPGPEKIAWCFRKRFYCLQMEGVIKKVCRECLTCNTNQGTEPKLPLVKWRTSAPLEVVAVDFLSLDTAQDGRSSVLVMIDHFTKFAVAIPTRDQTAVTAAKHLWNDFIQTYGCPQRIHSDQGPCFKSRLMQELCQLYNIKKSHTTPYHPQGNGVCERFNRTLIQKIRSLEQEKKQRWPVYIKELVWAYNHTVHDATGYAPFHLFFGREDGGPLDVLCGRLEGDQTSRTMQEWVENHKNRVQEMYDLVRRSNEKESETFERRWNFQVGDIVLLRNKGTHEKGKLTSRWGADLWKIVNQPSTDIPVYDVQKMDGTGPIKRVNGALLKLMSEPKPFGKSKNCEMELEEMVPCWVPVELSSGLTPQAQRNRDQNLAHPVDEWQDVSGLREESSGSSVKSERGSDADQQVEGSPELEPEGSLRRSSRENIGLPPKRYLQEEFIWQQRR